MLPPSSSSPPSSRCRHRVGLSCSSPARPCKGCPPPKPATQQWPLAPSSHAGCRPELVALASNAANAPEPAPCRSRGWTWPPAFRRSSTCPTSTTPRAVGFEAALVVSARSAAADVAFPSSCRRPAMSERGQRDVLSPVPADRLGLPGEFQHAEPGGRVAVGRRDRLLRLPAAVVGRAAGRQDLPTLSQHLPDQRRGPDERKPAAALLSTSRSEAD